MGHPVDYAPHEDPRLETACCAEQGEWLRSKRIPSSVKRLRSSTLSALKSSSFSSKLGSDEYTIYTSITAITCSRLQVPLQHIIRIKHRVTRAQPRQRLLLPGHLRSELPHSAKMRPAGAP